ncbi:MAG: hypothetical protein ABW110_17565 [Steroidobacteraceae bacterium]
MEALRTQVATLAARLTAAAAEATEYPVEQERPPHY